MAEADVPDLPSPEACVICLERLTERAIALPCKHDHFDFICLGTWLNEQAVCPLCKCSVTAIQYDLGKVGGGTIFTLPPEQNRPPSGHHGHHPYRSTPGSRSVPTRGPNTVTTRRSRRLRVHPAEAPPPDPAITFRRHIYQAQLYSLRVGTNRLSRHQNLTPSSFMSDPTLSARARTWIRRELAAFDFLDPASSTYGRADRRASNAEFLLEYIVAVVKSIDLRGSQGQAERLLGEYLGRENARLFLHELEAFLRSPYEKVEEWDAHVQYRDVDTGCT